MHPSMHPATQNGKAVQKPFRQAIMEFEKAIAKLPDATHGDSVNMPLKHSFAPGVYVREIFIPAGHVLTGKIHKHSHPNFLMQGEVLVVTEEEGTQHLVAPLSMISPWMYSGSSSKNRIL